MNDFPISRKDLAALGDSRKMVVLIEVEPLSDKFVPLMLTQDHWRRIEDAIFSKLPRCRIHPDKVHVTSDQSREVKIPDVREFYSGEEIAKARAVDTCEQGPELGGTILT